MRDRSVLKLSTCEHGYCSVSSVLIALEVAVYAWGRAGLRTASSFPRPPCPCHHVSTTSPQQNHLIRSSLITHITTVPRIPNALRLAACL